METKDWVLLIKNQTSGPYSKREIEELLSSGEARYSDHIWSSPLTKWYPIHELAKVDWDIKILTAPPPTPQLNADLESSVEDSLLDVVLQPRETPKLDFLEDDPNEAITENLAFSPLSALADEIVWDEKVDKISPLRKPGNARSLRLQHLSQSLGFSIHAIRNTEKTFLLGWFFVISGLLMLLAYIF